MRSFSLTVSSPDGHVFSGNALSLTVRGTEGELAVMAGHVPFVTYVKPCDCRIETEDGSERIGRIEGGVLTVSTDRVILLCGEFNWK
ncbi:MAG: F0F1 ATP synthase subunit epsilon [Clostridia bacterium]|nr:F0F1 ATP synthase subunit epsilon [Clostridia bacterium]